jgi:hypothetical protein
MLDQAIHRVSKSVELHVVLWAVLAVVDWIMYPKLLLTTFTGGWILLLLNIVLGFVVFRIVILLNKKDLPRWMQGLLFVQAILVIRYLWLKLMWYDLFSSTTIVIFNRIRCDGNGNCLPLFWIVVILGVVLWGCGCFPQIPCMSDTSHGIGRRR